MKNLLYVLYPCQC